MYILIKVIPSDSLQILVLPKTGSEGVDPQLTLEADNQLPCSPGSESRET